MSNLDSVVGLIFASHEEAARVERSIAHEPAWRAEQDAARIACLIAWLGPPEAWIAALHWSTPRDRCIPLRRPRGGQGAWWIASSWRGMH